jgi:hypothetical protein
MLAAVTRATHTLHAPGWRVLNAGGRGDDSIINGLQLWLICVLPLNQLIGKRAQEVGISKALHRKE